MRRLYILETNEVELEKIVVLCLLRFFPYVPLTFGYEGYEKILKAVWGFLLASELEGI